MIKITDKYRGLQASFKDSSFQDSSIKCIYILILVISQIQLQQNMTFSNSDQIHPNVAVIRLRLTFKYVEPADHVITGDRNIVSSSNSAIPSYAVRSFSWEKNFTTIIWLRLWLDKVWEKGRMSRLTLFPNVWMQFWISKLKGSVTPNLFRICSSFVMIMLLFRPIKLQTVPLSCVSLTTSNV